jgi:hypothetical protein
MLNSNFVSWRDQEGVNGFGAASEEQLSALLKALSVGQSINAPGSVVSGDGFALRVESLERTLRSTTFREEHIKLFKLLPTTPAYNTVEEYNQIHEYGQDVDAFIDDGGLPNETDAQYQRQYAIIKYLGTTRRVNHVATMIRPAHGNVIAQETVNGTRFLLKQIERALIYGDSSIDSLQFDGFKRLIEANSPAANIVDLHGKSLSEDNLEDFAMRMHDAPNYATPTHFVLNPRAHSDLSKSFFPKARYDLFGKQDNGMVGLTIRGATTGAGDIEFVPDVFVNDGGTQPTTAIGGNPPNPPSFSAQPSAGAGAGNWTSDEYGAYRYAVVAVGRNGKTAAVQDTAAVTNSAGSPRITMSVQAAAAGPATTYFEIYRTVVGGAAGTGKLIKRIKNTGGAVSIVDNDEDMPGTSIAIMFQMNMEAVCFKQLAPMMKIPLATIDLSIRWMQVLYGTPVLHTPGKILLVKNIGRAAGYVA